MEDGGEKRGNRGGRGKEEGIRRNGKEKGERRWLERIKISRMEP